MSTFLTTGHLKEDIVKIVASATPLILNLFSPSINHIIGTDSQVVILPNAQTLENGIHFIVVNDSTGQVVVKDFDDTILITLNQNSSVNLYLSDNSTSAGIWAKLTNRESGYIQVTAAESILRGSPVAINSSGELEIVDISNEDSSYSFCGISSSNYSIGEVAIVFTSGNTLQNIPFGITDYGKHIFVSHAGILTTTKPNIGDGDFESQDFILSVGITTKNVAIGTTDLILNPRLIGRLA